MSTIFTDEKIELWYIGALLIYNDNKTLQCIARAIHSEWNLLLCLCCMSLAHLKQVKSPWNSSVSLRHVWRTSEPPRTILYHYPTTSAFMFSYPLPVQHMPLKQGSSVYAIDGLPNVQTFHARRVDKNRTLSLYRASHFHLKLDTMQTARSIFRSR